MIDFYLSLVHNFFSNISSSDIHMIHEWDQQTFLFLQAALATTYNLSGIFNANELELGGQRFVNPTIGVRDQLTSARATPTQFKNLINFTLDEFKDLYLDVCPTIVIYVRTTGEPRSAGGQPYKFTLQQQIIFFLCC